MLIRSFIQSYVERVILTFMTEKDVKARFKLPTENPSIGVCGHTPCRKAQHIFMSADISFVWTYLNKNKY